MALNNPLESIKESDLQALVDNQVSERKTIEYKEALSGNADGDKKEFLADVSSFANASGGDLIYGIKEQSGVPIELRTYPNRKCKNGVFQNVCTENACHSEDQEMSSSQDVLGVRP
jgi:predicted HTH transcriptional regulator